MNSRYHYSLAAPDVVRIHDIQRGDLCPIGKKSLVQAIENVKANYKGYATEKAYKADLHKYIGALQFLENNQS